MIFRLETTDTTGGQGPEAFLASGRKLSLALALSFLFLVPVAPVNLLLPGFAAAGGDIRLEQLEMKFYKHTYSKETNAVRLERLEKMIFGESRAGSDAQRLKALADSVPNLSEVSLTDAGGGADANSGGGEAEVDSSGSSSKANLGRRTKVSGSNDSALDMSEERTNTARPSSRAAAGSQAQDSAAKHNARSQADESQYPAVTAMEEQLFNKNFVGESVSDRLERLELRVFGKASRLDDLSARVDALKERTRIDIAKQRPAGSDWVDEDEEEEYSKYSRSMNNQNVGRSDGDDGRSYSGRNLRQDMLKNFGKTGSTATFGGSGGYGMSGSSGTNSGAASGAYGMGGGTSYGSNGSGLTGPGTGARGAYGAYGNQPPASSLGRGRGASDDADGGDSGGSAPTSPVALSTQVSSLEKVVLGETGSGPLLDRVSRLEKAVLGDKAAQNASLPMPERIAKLLEKVPLASSQASRSRLAQSNKRRSSRSADDENDDDLNMDDLGNMGSMGSSSSMGLGGGMSGSMTQSGTRGSGLSKIMNGIGNLLGGGYSSGYYMPNTTYGRDPATGMYVDAAGNLINPSTGAIVGRSSSWGGMNSYTTLPQYGLNPYGGYGMSPPIYNNPLGNIYGNPAGTINPYGGYPGMNYGYSPYGYGGGSGIRFGGGGLGIRFGY